MLPGDELLLAELLLVSLLPRSDDRCLSAGRKAERDRDLVDMMKRFASRHAAGGNISEVGVQFDTICGCN